MLILDDAHDQNFSWFLTSRMLQKWLKETWTPTRFPQQEQLVQFLHNLPLEFPHAREFLHDAVLLGLSDTTDRYDAS